MWWIETTGYHLAGLIWLIVIAAVFVIAVVALSMAAAAANNARRTRRMVREHEAHHVAAGARAAQATDMSGTVPPPPMPDERKPTVVGTETRPPASSLGDSMRILHERYARGEITREEYLKAREDMMAMTR